MILAASVFKSVSIVLLEYLRTSITVRDRVYQRVRLLRDSWRSASLVDSLHSVQVWLRHI